MCQFKNLKAVAGAIAIMLTASVAFGVLQEKQVPRPKAEAVAQAKQSVDDIYGERVFKAKKPDEQTALARELMKVAGETGDDPAAQFVLLAAARDLAAEAKDWALTIEAIGAIVERFKADGPADPADQIKRGDELCASAKERPGKERLAAQLEAAEWYVRAKRDGKGLTRKLAEKSIDRLAEIVEVKRNGQHNDLILLIGTWRVVATNGYRDTWTFFADGTVQNGGGGKGTWNAAPTEIRIVWNKQAWETFDRPLNVKGTDGDSWKGKRFIKATKVK
jgi:hypothetical protein